MYKELGKPVKIFRYVTEGTFDSYSWQVIENKQKFIGQIMTSKSPVRSCDDVDEAALTYAEVKALCTGNPYIKEKMDLDIQVSKLKLMKANHTSNRYRLEDNIMSTYPKRIASLTESMKGYKADIAAHAEKRAELAAKYPMEEKEPFEMKVGNRVFTDKKEAGAALIAMCGDIHQINTPTDVGEYMGFKMQVTFEPFQKSFDLNLKGAISHHVEIGNDAVGNITRMNNALNGMEKKMEACEEKLAAVQAQLETAKVEVTKPFAQEGELSEKLERLNWLNAQLNMDEKGEEQEQTKEQSAENSYQAQEQSEEKSGQGFQENVPEDGENNMQSVEQAESRENNVQSTEHSVRDNDMQSMEHSADGEVGMRPVAVSIPTDRAKSAGYWTPQEQPAKPKSLMERIADKKAQIETKAKSNDRVQQQGIPTKTEKVAQSL